MTNLTNLKGSEHFVRDTYTQPGRNALTARECVAEIVVAEIVRSYELASEHQRGEPNLTVSHLAHAVLQYGAWQPWRFDKTDKQVTSMVRTTCEKLTKQGMLERSIGCGWNGREARCYAPTATLTNQGTN